ncbi:helix-turn-helix domain-containing protein [Umezawaea sp. Da 62-37]|uniref:TetR/AcrR family transcriptional regulator n=1 Tax=Umezawaea sp. Da 62-37 TaxID=3075927 RepID=UPI0028F740FD|nr:helix-turn-helix domain-containing protein [Umezawaea sp. Da 62-37]WNV87330.1 helix-turn-helix domain-containing protein [Umezawaea sp. Da 62-37]
MTAEPDEAQADRGRGRPPMTERRKEIIRLQIATVALDLFKSQGVAATSVEQIADGLGISTRTLWRYSPSKEGCVLPLLQHGIAVVVQKFHEWPRDMPLLEQLLHEEDLAEATPESTLDLVRLTRTEPAIRSVWLQSHLDSESAFAGVIAERTGLPPDALETKVQAGMLNVALRIALEHYAWTIDQGVEEPGSMTDATQTALRTAIKGLAM